jgi:hypothetical protein
MHWISGAAPPWISTSCCKMSEAWHEARTHWAALRTLVQKRIGEDGVICIPTTSDIAPRLGVESNLAGFTRRPADSQQPLSVSAPRRISVESPSVVTTHCHRKTGLFSKTGRVWPMHAGSVSHWGVELSVGRRNGRASFPGPFAPLGR